MKINEIFHQERFLGSQRKAPYFEGWYFRAVTPDGRSLSFIPGVSKSENDSHSFIQIIDSSGGSSYFTFPMSEFEYSKDKLYIQIGDNIFSDDGFSVKIRNNERINGTVYFKNKVAFPKSAVNPGIMGPFSYLPFLECNHCVICVRCDLEGQIEINGEKVELSGGVGYIEKDWGSSFPGDYIWAQSCRFSGSNASFMLSAARVPILGKNFTGLISFLYFEDRFYKFTTYNGSKIAQNINGKDVQIKTISRRLTLDVSLEQSGGGVLKAPVNGEMNRDIRESGSGSIGLTLRENGQTVFSGQGLSAGIEVCGNIFAQKNI